MRYMLLLYGNESEWSHLSEADQMAEMERYGAYDETLREAGVPFSGEALQLSSMATSVRADGDAALTTDGPFAETREQLGGFYIIDVPDLDQAIEWARRSPAAANGTVEVRPIMEMPGS